MIGSIKSETLDATSEVKLALEDAIKAAHNEHEWRMSSMLSRVLEEITQEETQTRAYTVATIGQFVKSLR